ncbi:enoyl-CoA hydratase/isomerase family protein [Streptomyces sp. NPDC056628]|uniref:enoyl-CoA hydratase/isomerase family protein n=1 Tax=Streptomyces sp. NPDC056628 TaxID=3345882 RepID=UPI00367AED37
MTAPEALVIECVGPVTTLTINRPEAFNALNAGVLAELRQAVLEAEADPAVRAVVVTGTGDKAFSAGADLKELAGMTTDRAHETMRSGQRVMRDIERAAVPVIAAVNGVALGGGFELVLASTFSVLSTRASLGLPESGLGLIPGYGGTQRLPRAVGAQTAAHLMLTGARLNADRAYQLGLTPVPPVAPEDLLATAVAMAEKIAAQGPLAVRSILTALEAGRGALLDTGLQLETGLAALAIGGAESDEGINAFLERRPAVFADPATAPEETA